MDDWDGFKIWKVLSGLVNILFLTQIVPYLPDAGSKVKTGHVSRALKAQGHTVSLAAFVRSEEIQNLSALEKICKNIHAVPIRRSCIADLGYLIRSYLTSRPFLVERDDLRSMQELVSELVLRQSFDYIHAGQGEKCCIGGRCCFIKNITALCGPSSCVPCSGCSAWENSRPGRWPFSCPENEASRAVKSSRTLKSSSSACGLPDNWFS